MNDLLDASPLRKQKEEAKHLVNKWEKTGLLDGLNEDFQKGGMATLLENQARQLISENSATGGNAGSGTITNAGSEEWSGVALPLVRRIFGEIAAQEFVSVQPMNLPSGLVFYLDFKYGKSVNGYGTTTEGISGGNSVESIGGKTGANTPSGSAAPYGVGGLYGEGRYDYSMNQVTTATLAGNATNYTSGTVSYKDINFNQEFSASLSANELVTNKYGHSIDADDEMKIVTTLKKKHDLLNKYVLPYIKQTITSEAFAAIPNNEDKKEVIEGVIASIGINSENPSVLFANGEGNKVLRLIGDLGVMPDSVKNYFNMDTGSFSKDGNVDSFRKKYQDFMYLKSFNERFVFDGDMFKLFEKAKAEDWMNKGDEYLSLKLQLLY